MTIIMTLNEWQHAIVPENQYIVQASTSDGLDGITAPSIGMCYGFVHFKGNTEICQIGSHADLAFCAINEGTDQRRRGTKDINRKQILKTLSNNGFNNVTIEADKYFTVLPNYKFVISPEGNGIDCHRHYEALMAGCIPIMEDNSLIREKYKGCPILFTKDYSEITPRYLEQKYREMLEQTYDFSKLFLSYYIKEQQDLIKVNGNYLVKKLCSKTWY